MIQISSNLRKFKYIKVSSVKCMNKLGYSTLNEIASGYVPKNTVADNSGITFKHSLSKNGNNSNVFSLLLPPPNITGKLHLGHALMCTLQDVLARWNKSQGFDVIWIPGTDHAGIATQMVVEKCLKTEKDLSRHDIGRDAFLKEVWKWKHEKGDQIKLDLEKLGTILNWENEYFTMDEEQSKSVNKAFIQLFEKNLIYRSDSLVNWSCSLESAISDIEVENIEITGPTSVYVPGYDNLIKFGEIVHIAYQMCNHEQRDGNEIIVSTTRPETILGDVAVAVHPNDSRYTHLIGRNIMLWHPFRNEPIPLVFDEAVNQSFGTGAVKITPGHDKFDFELAKRHSLPTISVIEENGKICENFGKFTGLKRFTARDCILNELANIGLLRDVQPHKMNLPICSRSKDIIEYLLKPQWFIRCKDMAKKCRTIVESGRIELHPKHFENDWYRWLNDNIHDWCISRQVWWGHKIPAYECTDGIKTIWVAAYDNADATQKAAKLLQTNVQQISIKQDNDVLDTWFSSAILPFSVFERQQNKLNQEKYFPLSLMCTGHDILFFWVARMVMLCNELTNDEIPFRKVLLHGIVCDAHGRKMSKSLGNVIYPEHVINGISLKELEEETKKLQQNGILSGNEVAKSLLGQKKMFPNGIPECGIDALRFTLCSHNIKNHFINFDANECHTNKLFFNKIWQAVRYTILAHTKQGIEIFTEINGIDLMLNYDLSLMDKWILSRLSETVNTIDTAIAEYNFHIACNALRTFFYGNFCDIYLETTKVRLLQKNDLDSCRAACVTLKTCLTVGLHQMQYFTPYLTTELLKHLPKLNALTNLHISQWHDTNLENDVNVVLNICQAIRQLKSERGLTKKYSPKVYLFFDNELIYDCVINYRQDIQSLTLCDDVILSDKPDDGCIKSIAKSTAGHVCSIGITANVVSKDTISNESLTLNDKKMIKLEKELSKLLLTTSQEGYQKSANPKIKEKHLEKINNLRQEISAIRNI